MGVHHHAQGALGPVPLADLRDHLGGQGVAVEHAQVDVEQRLLLGAQALLGALGKITDFLAHPHQGLIEQSDLRVNVLHFPVRHRGQVGFRKQQHRLADGRAGGAGLAVIDGGQFLVGVELFEQRAGGVGVGDHRRELRRDGDQEGLLALVETARVALLHHQDAEHVTVVHHRHAEEGVEGVFAGFRQVMEFRVREGVFQVDGLLAQAHLPHQTLGKPQADPADRLALEALGGHQHVTLFAVVAKVDGTHLGAHGIAHALGHQIQSGRDVRRVVHFLHDAAQGIEHADSS